MPRIRLLRGEHSREFVLSRQQERLYLGSLPQLSHDVAAVLLDTGLRLGEALSLEWPQVHLQPAPDAKFGHLIVLSVNAKNKKFRKVPLSPRAASAMMRQPAGSGLVFQMSNGSPVPVSHLDHQHARIRALLKFPSDFVLHSLRHTYGTRLGEAGASVFEIMRLMGHSTITVSQRYVHPSPKSIELPYERMIELNMQNAATVSATVASDEMGRVQ